MTNKNGYERKKERKIRHRIFAMSQRKGAMERHRHLADKV
jgi:hypothetical protein